ncbi:hypothetical protein ASC61_02000 [Aeromicrobium sp. Root344]|uniref:hypothetical protein n=1 Tax=Aeromicrobium sp. Root344 TaxID=1736521 RepID=UPI0006F73265|nr:hypothetical protein [Aeromicrobium sp. Root344]KQV73877.1 hypothetical protein ASC61_02000 [Aeromicrobium sp. Root344]
MTALFIVLFSAVLVLAIAGCLAAESEQRGKNLHSRQQNAAQAIDDEYRQAKRSMNDAADQSWRNIIE